MTRPLPRRACSCCGKPKPATYKWYPVIGNHLSGRCRVCWNALARKIIKAQTPRPPRKERQTCGSGTCLVCGATFEKRREWQVCCSRRCQNHRSNTQLRAARQAQAVSA